MLLDQSVLLVRWVCERIICCSELCISWLFSRWGVLLLSYFRKYWL